MKKPERKDYVGRLNIFKHDMMEWVEYTNILNKDSSEQQIEEAINTNIDDPMRHNIGGSMNRPVRNEDPHSPRNQHDSMTVEDAIITDEMTEFELKLNDLVIKLRDMLLSKNAKYGNSALEPKRIFSKADSVEQIKVRIDDKLSRIANGAGELTDEDTIDDLMGYLILLKMSCAK